MVVIENITNGEPSTSTRRKGGLNRQGSLINPPRPSKKGRNDTAKRGGGRPSRMSNSNNNNSGGTTPLTVSSVARMLSFNVNKPKTYQVSTVAKEFMKRSLVPKAERELVNQTRPPSNKSKALTTVKNPSKTIVLPKSPNTPTAVSSSSSEGVPIETKRTQSRVFNSNGKVEEGVSNLRRKFESVLDGVTGDGENIKLNMSDYQKQLNKLQTSIERLDKKINRKKMEKKSLAIYKKKLNALLNDVSKLKLVIAKRSSPKTTTTSTQTSSPKKTPSPKPTTIRSLVTNQSVNKIVKAITERDAKVPSTPPGITKTNLERLFQPFKQPVTVTVAPTISVKGGSVQATGGSAKQGIVMLASNATKKKKKTPPPKPQYLKTPGTIRREKEKARSIAVRKQVVASMRTPTKGKRKTHVIQLIDRVLRKMKAPKDTEKKLIKLYESLSEKQIKSLFGGRSPEFVKKTLKKQVEYLKKKR
jgi:hypothetical protein